MNGINTGLLKNAFPISDEQVAELEVRVLQNHEAFAYLDKNSQLCFLLPKGAEVVDTLAWQNAYELKTESDGRLIKAVYKKTGLTSFALSSTFKKDNLTDSWIINASVLNAGLLNSFILG